MRRRPAGRVLLILSGLALVGVVMALGAAYALLGRTAGVPAASRRQAAVGTPLEASGSVTSVEPSASAAASSPLDAYRGLATWVDIYDGAAWKGPDAAVADMARHGVRTLFLETGNSGQPVAIYDPEGQAAFIRAAHARDMRVVAWYLPDLTDPTRDYDRVAAAIAFRTGDGQRFDSFALDIESGKVPSLSARNSRLATLSSAIRSLVGPGYPLGGIIPSPVGLSRKPSYWPQFPYAMVARTYDVFVPMSYYTYHGKGSAAAYADTMANVAIIRAQNGCSTTPIHLIGGIAEASSPQDAAGFVRAAVDARVIGAGLYGWAGTGPAHWRELTAIKP